MKRAALLLGLLALPALGQGVSNEFLQHWNYDKKAPLNIKQTGVEDHLGTKVYDLTYSSPVGDRGPVVGPNGGIVAAYLVVPRGKGPFPSVIYSHWCPDGSDKANRTEFLAEALVLAHSGVVSLLPDAVRVRPGFPEPAKDQSPLNEEQFGLPVQELINLRRGVDLLLARKDVDPGRLAYVGHSWGAQSGGYLSGIDKRFKAFVLMAGGLSDEVDLKNQAYQDLRQQVGAERFDAFVAQHWWTDIGKYVSHAAPATVLLQYASHDDYFSSDDAKQYAEVVSEPKKFKMYDAHHALNAEATRDRVAFLAEQLSFRPPDAKAVAGIPVLVDPPLPTGYLTVDVEDPTGTPIAKASVKVQHRAGQRLIQDGVASTDAHGRASFELGPADYEVLASEQGFVPAVATVEVYPGRKCGHVFRLQIGQCSPCVEVSPK